ncbi:MAG: hypothetical protein FWC26_15380 [Fibromonadales bacterium]|nr:hypothetical protein [Fibromonadales bacterium]
MITVRKLSLFSASIAAMFSLALSQNIIGVVPITVNVDAQAVAFDPDGEAAGQVVLAAGIESNLPVYLLAEITPITNKSKSRFFLPNASESSEIKLAGLNGKVLGINKFDFDIPAGIYLVTAKSKNSGSFVQKFYHKGGNLSISANNAGTQILKKTGDQYSIKISPNDQKKYRDTIVFTTINEGVNPAINIVFTSISLCAGKNNATQICDERDGNTYKIVTIGSYTWMAKNLNYNASDSYCHNVNDANCVKYGRLYNWPTAMNLAATCRTNSCVAQVQSNHKGICPEGWHIPSDAELTALTNYVGTTPGTKLKATSGWKAHATYGNGTDDYGFSALPGGYGFFDGSSIKFYNIDSSGNWWSSSENGATVASYRSMNYDRNTVYSDNRNKSYLYSVRCLQDYETVEPSSSSAALSSSSYKTVVIGTQTWMAENLNYDVPNNTTDVCYGDKSSNCNKYGRLYDWVTAMDLPSHCESGTCKDIITAKWRGICPSGWHIPSDAEWTTLINYVGSSPGKKLKTTSGWNFSEYDGHFDGNGTNDYSFSALPGGSCDNNNVCILEGSSGYWWTSSEYSATGAYFRHMYYSYTSVEGNGNVDGGSDGKISSKFSVRCVKD